MHRQQHLTWPQLQWAPRQIAEHCSALSWLRGQHLQKMYRSVQISGEMRWQ